MTGVKQGDNLAPTIFLFMMQAAMELVARKWKELDILPFKYNHTTIHSNGKLVQHKKKDTHLMVAELFMILYVDDGAIMFCNRENLQLGSKVVT